MATGEHEARMSASKGSYVVNNTVAYNARRFDGFLVLEDTIIAALTDTDGGVLANYVAAPGTAIKAGAFIVPRNNEAFTSITLTSGSVVLIND